MNFPQMFISSTFAVWWLLRQCGGFSAFISMTAANCIQVPFLRQLLFLIYSSVYSGYLSIFPQTESLLCFVVFVFVIFLQKCEGTVTLLHLAFSLLICHGSFHSRTPKASQFVLKAECENIDVTWCISLVQNWQPLDAFNFLLF